MKTTKYGFVVDYDTTRMQKYKKDIQDKIVSLKRNGLSQRKIAKELNIPSGSIHYILRGRGEINIINTRPNINYLTRSEARYLYDLTDSQFDYYRGRYSDMFKKVGNVVYAHRDIFECHIIDKLGYKRRYEME